MNYRTLLEKESQIRTLVQTCIEPCTIKISKLSSGIKYDWVLPPLFQSRYLEWIHLKYFPLKNVKFEIDY